MKGQDWDMLRGVESLPVQVESAGPRRGAPLFVRLLLLVAVLAAAIVFASPGSGQNAKIAVSVIVALTVVLWLLARAHARSVRRQWVITPTKVEFAQRSALRTREWTEPLGAYKGVLGTTEWRGHGESGELWHILSLEHRTRPRRTVKLYESRSAAGLRRRHEQAARLLGLPYLLRTNEGLAERQPDELDISVRQRVATGEIEASFDLASCPSGARSVRVDGDTVTIATGQQMLGLVGALIAPCLLGFGILIAVIGVVAGLSLSHPVVQVGGSHIFLGAVVIAVSRCLREELAVSPREVTWRLCHPWGVLRERSVPASRVEEVVASSSVPGSGPVPRPVRIITDDAELWFGRFLSQAAKEWARDCIIAVVGGLGPQAPA
ncbi:MAG: hypothetical protein ACYS8L_01975 [Planctomycetota bacterium]|jgi:hypothetical protein